MERSEGAVLQNEFAVVEVDVERGATGDRLVIRDRVSGAAIRLDPLELESLARSSHATLRALLEPRMSDEEERR